MSFGSLLGSATGATSATGTSLATSTSLTVSVGDLVILDFFVRSASSAPTFSDNLSNTWNSLLGGSGTGYAGYAAYTIVTNAGTMTPSTAFASNGASKTLAAAQYSGPFAASPLDANPAMILQASSGTFSSPSTGTLAQANELILSYIMQTSTTAPTVTSPFNKDVGISQSGSLQAYSAIASEVVSSTASQSASWTATTGILLGIASFKGVSGPIGDIIQMNQSVKRAAYW